MTAGGVAGALLRWRVNKVATKHSLSIQSTAAINTVGSFVLGCAFQLSQQGRLSKNTWLLIGTGFCGSFTTFSTFSVDVVALLHTNAAARAISLIAVTNICGIAVRVRCVVVLLIVHDSFLDSIRFQAAFAGIKSVQMISKCIKVL